jgi:hypothetical protein
MTPDTLRPHLQAFEFERLFNELGWDNARQTLPIVIKDQTYELRRVAQKRGFAVFVCEDLPTYAERVRIEQALSGDYRENLLIFYDRAKSEQRWFWSKRELGKPLARRERTYSQGQSGESLLQVLRHLAFSLAEEDSLNLPEVAGRVKAAFDVERVTKKFYERFKKEHDTFRGFITGIPDVGWQAWYASIMLNRLMFVYFIQNKNFLDGKPRYLQDHLAQATDNYYKDFLLPLFFDGFARKDKSDATRQLLGEVPYLNGGLFMPHSIEKTHGATIHIPNEAFAKIFAFFEQYRWHLDERPLKKDDEINPDVLGYIFEKYINQKQMGAYYTKEDITEYISKNTILPFVIEQAQHDCAIAFEGEYSVWGIAQAQAEHYVYEAVKHGTHLPLPTHVAKGESDVRQREAWNTPTPAEWGLPTEIWRETIARRNRHRDLMTQLKNGDIRHINDFITHNLDMRQFVQDIIQNAESSDLIKAFWKAITQVTVLDPTCGSGAFLFAALNVLEPLYEACLGRMRGFISENRLALEKNTPENTTRKNRYAEFEAILAQVDTHANEKYFIYKQIILNNLFGVDIMDEAVEICKLRLFLKLVAQEDDPRKIEPLPDIDFNIRAGNTLVGFATESEIKGSLFAQAILPQLETMKGTLNTFRQEQLNGNISSDEMHRLKTNITAKQGEIARVLDEALAPLHGFGTDTESVSKFKQSHKPFHWVADFYGVLARGGFDVIIGNPPYVEYSKVRNEYRVFGYKTENAGNLYAFVMERSNYLIRKSGFMSMIVPVASVCSNRAEILRNIFVEKCRILVSSYDTSPSRLFDVDQRLTIWIAYPHTEKGIYSTRYHHWNSDERSKLLHSLQYEPVLADGNINSFPKVPQSSGYKILEKMYCKSTKTLNTYRSKQNKEHFAFYQEATRYWIKCALGLPYYEKNGVVQALSHGRYIYGESQEHSSVIFAIMNSSLFYLFFATWGDGFHVSDFIVNSFPIVPSIFEDKDLAKFGLLFDKSLRENALRKQMNTKQGYVIRYDEYRQPISKPIIDDIDRALAQHYGFSDEELDFIINYDIKYRMGDELEGEGE